MPRRILSGFCLLVVVLIANAALAAWNVAHLPRPEPDATVTAQAAARFDDCTHTLYLTIALGTALSLALAGLAFSLDLRDSARAAATEEQLRQQREWLEVALMSIGDGVIAADEKGRVALLSPVAQALTGWSREEAAGRPVAEVFRTARQPDDQLALVGRDGAARPIDSSAAPIRDARGRELGSILVFRDVSDRIRREEEARRDNGFLRRLASASLAMHSASSPDSLLQVVAEEARGLIGARLAAVSLLIVGGADRPRHAASLADEYARWRDCDGWPTAHGLHEAVCATNRPARLAPAEVEGRAAGEHPPLRGWLAAPLVSRGGRNLGLIQVADKAGGDLTAEDEAALVQLARIASVAIENARLTERLREADRQKDEFLAMLAHELRNPLAPVRNAAQVLRLRPDDRETVGWAAGLIERQASHMTRLVDDLLDVSRLARGKARLQRQRIDLVELVRTAAQDQQEGVEKAGLELRLELPEGPVWVQGDAVRLAQVVGNLLHNAAKFTDAGGRVTVRLEAGPRHAAVTVEDTGIGIEPALLPRLFDVFSQGESGEARGKGGLGLGLSLVKGLVELHGGRVEAHSEGPGRGASFRFTLPLDAGEASAANGAAEGRPLRVLLIEDNIDAALSVRVLLELDGHEVRLAHSGPAGVEAAREWRPGVVLCDLGLPGMSGYDVARALREDEATEEVRLIALSGYGAEEGEREALAAGFDRALAKPVEPGALRRLLAEA